MDAHDVADRSLLLARWHQHPEWTNRTLAPATGRSLAWVTKWQARFRAHPDDPDLIWGRTRAPLSAAAVAPCVIERIRAIGATPAEQLRRTPGPRAILYFVPRSPDVQGGERLPRSTRTSCKILRAHDRIARIAQHRLRPHGTQQRPAPLVELHLDCKDGVQVEPLASAKQAPAGAVFDAVDVGTSLWRLGEPSASSTAATVFAPLLHLRQQIGLPQRVCAVSCDPRLLGSTSLRDVPTAFLRFWHALGVQPVVTPPRRPDQSAFVERWHATVECA